MTREFLHKSICQQKTKITDWYCSHFSKLAGSPGPIYSSYDIRDAGFKVASIDANIYPAGFNNICPVDKETATELFADYFKLNYKKAIGKVLLITEEHTQNPYYWDNVAAIQRHLLEVGCKVLIAFPKRLEKPISVQSASGIELKVHSGFGDSCDYLEFNPDLIISNNDFSIANEEWANSVKAPINPLRELGWFRRKKSTHFKFYNQLAVEFAELMGFDPFLITATTEEFDHFNLEVESSITQLSDRVDSMLQELQDAYTKRGIQQKPFVFVKNNAGTYGLAVVRVASGKDVLEWSYKSRKKMKAAKGGRDVESVIIQEGIPSRVESDGATAEPVIYMVGKELAGGFLRVHGDKDKTESLNSPGAVYKKLCVSDLQVSLEGSPLENVYGWCARLAYLAICQEQLALGLRQ